MDAKPMFVCYGGLQGHGSHMTAALSVNVEIALLRP